MRCTFMITCRTLVWVTIDAGVVGVITPDDDGCAQLVAISVEPGQHLVLHADEAYLLHACTQEDAGYGDAYEAEAW